MATDQNVMTHYAWTAEDGHVKVVHAIKKEVMEMRERERADALLVGFRCPVIIEPMPMAVYYQAIGIPEAAQNLIELAEGYEFPSREKREFWRIVDGAIVIDESEFRAI